MKLNQCAALRGVRTERSCNMDQQDFLLVYFKHPEFPASRPDRVPINIAKYCATGFKLFKRLKNLIFSYIAGVPNFIGVGKMFEHTRVEPSMGVGENTDFQISG